MSDILDKLGLSAETIRKYSKPAQPSAPDAEAVSKIIEAVLGMLLFRINDGNKSDVAERAWILEHAIERKTKFEHERRFKSQMDLAESFGSGKQSISNRICEAREFLRALGVDF
jgi:hypothetical protein